MIKEKKNNNKEINFHHFMNIVIGTYLAVSFTTSLVGKVVEMIIRNV